ncbi:MAG: diguanylate cyclase [Selenomonadaceae bacterium]|nr:diguanylate cyclase [Selenomonadaceae bacterium]
MSLRTKLLLSNSLPLIIFVIISLALSITQFRSAIYEEKEGNLRSTALAALTFYTGRGYGDYSRRPDGNIWRGMNFNLSESSDIVDDLKTETGSDITVYFDKDVVMTSLKDHDVRVMNLEMDARIVEHVLKNGNQIWFKDIVINGEPSMAYAIPILQESDGSIAGALVASQSAKGFNATIRKFVLTTLAVVVVVLILIGIFVWCHADWFAQKFSEVRDKSRQDLLTGLLNKLTFETDTKAALEKKKDGVYGALFIFDFDNFKKVNDNYGHLAGDEALKSFGNILTRSFRAYDIIGRVGGDEFMVYMPDLPEANINRADEIANEVLDELKKVVLSNGATGFSCSIGIGTSKEPIDFASLYKVADRGLYIAKENGKAQAKRMDKTEVKPGDKGDHDE